MDKIRIGITHGDTNGVGYEVILKAFENPAMFDLCTPIVYGSPKIASCHMKHLGMNTVFASFPSADKAVEGKLNVVDVIPHEVKVEFGTPSAEAGNAALCSLESAMADYAQGLVDVLITAPIHKKSIQSEQFHFPGHTEYIQEKVGEGDEALMILMSEHLRIALATTHLPIQQVAETLSKELILKKIHLLNDSLRRDFLLTKPRIAVLSLNPHAGEEGLLGKEEEEIIVPAIKEAEQEGIICYGPFAADGFFGQCAYRHFDAVLAMYHDQGLAPFKLLAMDEGVNYTAGLSLVRTSPAHGTAFDIAGKGVASATSFIQALYTAIDIYRNRKRYDEAYQNPLKKMYLDKKDDRKE